MNSVRYPKHSFDEHGNFLGSLPPECIADCSAPGRVDGSVAYWQRTLQFNPPRIKAKEYLAETGAWTRAEIDELSDTNLAQKILWLACVNLKEHGHWLGLMS